MEGSVVNAVNGRPRRMEVCWNELGGREEEELGRRGGMERERGEESKN